MNGLGDTCDVGGIRSTRLCFSLLFGAASSCVYISSKSRWYEKGSFILVCLSIWLFEVEENAVCFLSD